MNYRTSNIAQQPRKPSYKKSEAVQELERLADDEIKKKYPDTPLKFLAQRTFRDDSANGLTGCIIAYIRLKGFQAERINSTGRYYKSLGKFITSSGQKGTADISATVFKGLSLKIEVKIGKDRQSIDQIKYQHEISRSGGLYYIAKDFETWFDNLE